MIAGFIIGIFVLNSLIMVSSKTPTPPYLKIESVKYASERLYFVDMLAHFSSPGVQDYYYYEVIRDAENLSGNVMFYLPSNFFIVIGNYSRIKITLGEDVWIDEDIKNRSWDKNATLKEKLYPVYNLFGPRNEYDYIAQMSNLEKYDDSTMSVYLDNELVRDYSVKYYPGSDVAVHRDIDGAGSLVYWVAGFISVIAIIVLIVILLKRKNPA